MGHHITSEGTFQSDKYPDLAPDKIVLSFKDKEAQEALKVFAHTTNDRELAEDILERLLTISST
jgi:hypothetical protein